MASAGIDYEALKSDELTSLLKERGLPSSGTKAQKKARLLEADSRENGQVTEGRDADMKDVGETTSSSAPGDAAAEPGNEPYDYVMMCQPTEDYVREQRDTVDGYDSDEDPFLRPAKRHELCEICRSRFKMCGRPIVEDPDYPWIIMRRGLDGMQLYTKEAMKRNQDALGQHHYSDYNGYGTQEVIQNLLKAFNKEYSKKKKNPFELWLYIETLSRVDIEDSGLFYIDDNGGLLEMLAVIGWMVLATLNELERAGLLKPGSQIKDVTITVGLLFQMLESWPGDRDARQLMWGSHVAHKLDDLGYKFAKVPHDIESTVESLLDDEPLDDEMFDDDDDAAADGEDVDPKAPIDWRQVNWKEKFAEYSSMHCDADTGILGGEFYVLEKVR